VTYGSVPEFLNSTQKLEQTLNFLKSVNREFRSQVQEKALALNQEESKDQDDYNICGICFYNKIGLALNCGHSFCEPCIHDWQKKSESCPMCRDTIKEESTAFEVIDNSV
jgi:hypothetical protein